MKFFATLVILALVAVTVSADDATSASTSVRGHLLVQKTITSQTPNIFAKGQNFTVELTVTNIGEGAAYSISVNDPVPEAFSLHSGETTLSWDELAPGAKVSANYSLVPNEISSEDAPFEIPQAMITYQTTVDAAEPQVAYSSTNYPMLVVSEEMYTRLTATHVREWSVFTIGLLLFVVGPFVLYQYIQLNYEHGIPKSLLKSE